MMSWLEDWLTSQNGFVRKGAQALLTIPKLIEYCKSNNQDLTKYPPVLANSFPKSGTHLLFQLVEGLPGRKNYGAFLSSQTSSFQLRERSAQNTCSFIKGFVPGEIIRGHLYFDQLFADELSKRHAVNYFIYRDPRDVVISEAHYLRDMNRWHRLHPYFARAGSLEDAIMLSINGLSPPIDGIDYPDIAARFARYQGWLEQANCFAVRYEDLVSNRQQELIVQMAEFYAARSGDSFDVKSAAARMSALVAPKKSHTFRSGKKAGWQKEFTSAHRKRFAEVAGDLLVRLGYEQSSVWATEATPC
jgi:hypothetical protein